MNQIPYQYLPPKHTALDVLYMDENLLVVNKPAGLLSVPGNSPEKQDCMISRLQKEFPEALTVHRLDMSTSGILLFARNKSMHRTMSIMFAERTMDKTYTAIVDGVIKEEQGEVNQPLITDWPNRPRQKVDHEFGKPSHTCYQVLSRNPSANTTHIRLLPISGRSHQLRVHMMIIGHSILGDKLYASDKISEKADRLLLHAIQLAFVHPLTGQPVSIDCPPCF